MILSCLIPHAKQQFAGNCRRFVFQKIRNQLSSLFPKTQVNFDNIIFIAANHGHLKSGLVRYNDVLDIFKNYKIVTSPLIEEHSYTWVETEIRDFFSGVPITVVYPDKSFMAYISKLNMPINKKILVIGTSDYIHNFSGKYSYKEKINLESEFLEAICKLETDKVSELYSKNTELCCGISSIKFVMQIVKMNNQYTDITKNRYYYALTQKSVKQSFRGQIVDYYDSEQSEETGIDRYSLRAEKTDEFVSYAGIVFEPYTEIVYLNNLDIKLGIAGVKNMFDDILDKKVDNIIVENYIPKFSNFYKIYNGIFISTKVLGEDKTSSCIGRFQDNMTNTAEFIGQCIKDCIEDSINRWKLPLRKNKFRIVISLLETVDKWKKVPNIKDEHKKLGLFVKSDRKKATFLPSTWKNTSFRHLPSEILNMLLEKANISKGEKYELFTYNVSEYDITVFEKF